MLGLKGKLYNEKKNLLTLLNKLIDYEEIVEDDKTNNAMLAIYQCMIYTLMSFKMLFKQNCFGFYDPCSM